MAEMLIVVAIIIILSAVAFIAVSAYQRSSTRLEFDTIAREIFYAAQNHMTAAKSQGYLSIDGNQYGYPGKIKGDKGDEDDIFFLLSGDEKSKDMLKLVLPDYAITFSGSYIIRYQVSTGKVLDVFYSNPGKSSFLSKSGKTLVANDYDVLMGEDPSYREGGERNRENYPGGGENCVVGWYGGEEAEETGLRLRAPSIEIINAEKLEVRVTDPNTTADPYILKLIVTGKTSGAEAYFTLYKTNGTTSDSTGSTGGPYTVVLDDITAQDRHFSKIVPDKGTFTPGENLLIKAVAYSTDKLSNVAMSAEGRTNSLFADLKSAQAGGTIDTAVINNIRHLENLDKLVSNLSVNGTSSLVGGESYAIAKAQQTSDLIWTSDDDESGFTNRIKKAGSTTTDPSIWLYNGSAPATSAGKYYPVSPAYSLVYDGQGHSVLNLDVSFDRAAGMFGELNNTNNEIKNEIKNVVVRNDLQDDSALEIKSTSTSGSAGGLVGSMTGGKITNCAAAVYVNGVNAGGLIGSASNVAVMDCYSGGHTKDGKYLTAESDAARVNVIGSTNAGGLIGSIAGGTATNCYSTCSAKGATAGGFAGTASGTVSNSYCTGLVLGTNVNAFVGNGSELNAENNYFSSIVNDRHYAPLSDDFDTLASGCNGAVPFDRDRLDGTTLVTAYEAYRAFRPADLAVNEAVPYDVFLKAHFQKADATAKTDYPYKTISQMDSNAPAHLAKHYGDWPMPETIFINK